MKNLLIFFVVLFIVACNPVKKAVKVFDSHREDIGAPWCFENYPALPVDSVTSYEIDSGAYQQAIESMSFLIDSLLNACNDTSSGPGIWLDPENGMLWKDSLNFYYDRRHGRIIWGNPKSLDSLRTILTNRIKKTLKPITITEIRTVTKIDNAAVTSLTFKLGEEHEARIKAEVKESEQRKAKRTNFWLLMLMSFLFGGSIFFHVRKIFK